MTDTCKARAFTCALVAIAILLTMLSPLAQAQVEVRLKDVGKLVGVTTNQLIGYGIVTGLAGTGDRSSELRDRSLANMMSHFGLTAEPYDIKSRNTAAVVVTAKLPAFVKVGDQIDATLSSLFDAKSLEGGILLMTHLQGADGRTYAVAQGAVSIGGSNSMTGRGDFRNHATVATIPGGAIVQAEVPSNFVDVDSTILYSLNSADFTLAARAADAANSVFGQGVASARDASTISVNIPEAWSGDIVGFIAQLENLVLRVDEPGKIVINEKTGTVVLGGNVKVAQAVVAHGALTVRVLDPQQASTEDPAFDMGLPGAYSGESQSQRLAKIEGASVDELIRALNAIGASPRDLIAILQALRASGALQAEIEVI
jgi:flagellar P-ring protein precursor FlgI